MGRVRTKIGWFRMSQDENGTSQDENGMSQDENGTSQDKKMGRAKIKME